MTGGTTVIDASCDPVVSVAVPPRAIARAVVPGVRRPVRFHVPAASQVSPVAVQMWQEYAQSRCRCDRGEPIPGADVGKPSTGADVAGVSPVAVEMWAR